MRAVFAISKKAALGIARSFAQADEYAGFGAQASGWLRRNVIEDDSSGWPLVVEPGLALRWSTCSGLGCYDLDLTENGWTLAFTGSRRSFDAGCYPIRIYSAGCTAYVADYMADTEYRVELLDWSTSIPGNPDPFEDWESFVEQQKLLTAPLNIGEIIEMEMTA
ncbi:MAG: hypothetical protein KDK05_20915 [Candidatus Competibacteraceae bacterium]|nr:hypothetical protein [Candidatus Competibacteraceae bacterium]